MNRCLCLHEEDYHEPPEKGSLFRSCEAPRCSCRTFRPGPVRPRHYGKAKSREEAYREGYAAKYYCWTNQENPYQEMSPEHEGFLDGYAEACVDT